MHSILIPIISEIIGVISVNNIDTQQISPTRKKPQEPICIHLVFVCSAFHCLPCSFLISTPSIFQCYTN